MLENLLLLQNNYQQAIEDGAKTSEMVNILECKVVKAEAHALEIYNDSKTEIDNLKEGNCSQSMVESSLLEYFRSIST